MGGATEGQGEVEGDRSRRPSHCEYFGLRILSQDVRGPLVYVPPFPLCDDALEVVRARRPEELDAAAFDAFHQTDSRLDARHDASEQPLAFGQPSIAKILRTRVSEVSLDEDVSH